MRLALLLLFPASLVAQSRPSAEPAAARRARETVALINTGTPSAIATYVDSAFSAELRADGLAAHAEFLYTMRDQARGLRVLTVSEGSAGLARATVRRALTGDRKELIIATDTTPPYRVVGYGVRPPAPDSTGRPPKVVTDAELTAAIDRYVAQPEASRLCGDFGDVSPDRLRALTDGLPAPRTSILPQSPAQVYHLVARKCGRAAV